MLKNMIILFVYAKLTFSKATSCHIANAIIRILFKLSQNSRFFKYFSIFRGTCLCFFNFLLNPFVIKMIIRHMMLYFIRQIWSLIEIKPCSPNMNSFRFF